MTDYQSILIDILKEIDNALVVSDRLYQKSLESNDPAFDRTYIIGYLRGALISVQAQLEGI